MKNLSYIFLGLFTAFFYLSESDNSTETKIERIIPDISLCTAGRMVTIEGKNLPRDPLVYLGDQLIHSGENKSSSRIKARIPEKVPYGTYELRIVSAGQRNIPGKPLTLLASETAPIVSCVHPDSLERSDILSSRGSIVSITGTNFNNHVQVSLGSRYSGQVIECNDSKATVIFRGPIPKGKYDINITNENGERGSLRNAVTVQ